MAGGGKNDMVKEARMKCVESMHKQFTFYVEGRKVPVEQSNF